MADIRIKKKRKGKDSGVVYWVLGFVLVAILIIWAVADFSTDVERKSATRDVTDQEIAVRKTSNASADYLNFVNELNSRRLIDYSVTSTGLLKLSNALQELGGTEVEQDVRSIASNARAILQTENYQMHAQMAGEAFVSAANALEVIQENKLPGAGNEVVRVKEVARSLDKDKALMDQKEIIGRFFEETAQVVEEAGTPVESPS